LQEAHAVMMTSAREFFGTLRPRMPATRTTAL
jgi:hypothetical protein